MSFLNTLIKGYKNFRHLYFQAEPVLFEQLVQEGQSPQALVIACCDSRVDPAIIFQCKPGDLFIVRNVANLVPPFEEDGGFHGVSAAMEFAVVSLKVKHIIVLGHTLCGGINSLFSERSPITNEGHFISRWMTLASEPMAYIKKNHGEEPIETQQSLCSHYTVQRSLANLTTFPWIQDQLDKKKLEIHGWVFDLHAGLLRQFDHVTQKFVPLEEKN